MNVNAIVAMQSKPLHSSRQQLLLMIV